MSRHCTGSWVVVAVLALRVLTACHDVTLLDDGAACSDDAQCRSGWCGGTCNDPEADNDADGLLNRNEFERGTSLGDADTDRDGFGDALEGLIDTDGDGRIDALESNLADRDQDCIVDALDAADDTAESDLATVALLACPRLGLCAPRANGTPVVGARCDAGRLTCTFDDVPGWQGGVERACDGLDNDCDGQTDEHFSYIDPSNAILAVGTPCNGTGTCAQARGLVECAPDAQRAICSVNADGSAFAGLEIDVDCDGLDNDCDGQTDEAIVWREPVSGRLLSVGAPCRAEGACGLAFGVVECAPDGASGRCSTGPGGSADQSRDERCNGLDDDCDGVRDEGLGWLDVHVSGDGFVPLDGACGRGICAGGQVVCSADGGTVCSTAARARAEVCNGLDDDCDGQTDESVDVRVACPAVGKCATSEVVSGRCDGTSLICRYGDGSLWTSGATETACDAVDDDCDGLIDEDFGLGPGRPYGSPCSGQGACAGVQGVVVCAPGGGGALCSADLGGQPEICNGIDDDCDGRVDFGLVPPPDVCRAPGICADSAGAGTCAAGRWRCAFEDDPRWAGPDTPESACDALDNDCDGAADEGLLGGVLAPGEPLDLHVFAPQGRGAFARRADATWFFGRENNGWQAWRFDGSRRRFERVGERWSVGADVAGTPDGQSVETAPRVAHLPENDVFVVLFESADSATPATLALFSPTTGRWLQVPWSRAPGHRLGGALVAFPVGNGVALFIVGGRGTDGTSPPVERLTVSMVDDVPTTASVAPVQSDVLPGLPALTEASVIAAPTADGGTVVAMVGTPMNTDGVVNAVGVVWRVREGRIEHARLVADSARRWPARPALGFAGPSEALGLVAWTAADRVAWELGSMSVAATTVEAVAVPHGADFCADDAFDTNDGADGPVVNGRCGIAGHDALWWPGVATEPLAQPTAVGRWVRGAPAGLVWVGPERLGFRAADAWHVTGVSPWPWPAAPTAWAIAGGPGAFTVGAVAGGQVIMATPTADPAGWHTESPPIIAATLAVVTDLAVLGTAPDDFVWWAVSGRDADGLPLTLVVARTSDGWTSVDTVLDGLWLAGILTPGENVGHLLLDADGPRLHRLDASVGANGVIEELGAVAPGIASLSSNHVIAAPAAKPLFFAVDADGWLRIDGLQTMPEEVPLDPQVTATLFWVDGIGPAAVIDGPGPWIAPLVLGCDAPLD